MNARSARTRRRRFARAMRYAVVLCVGLGAVALYLLSTATANTTAFAEHYPTLLLVNGALVLVLVALLAYQLVRLGRRLRRREFGSRLALRFVLLLALMSLLPGALVYTVSVKFLARSIESWFDVKVDAALEGGELFACRIGFRQIGRHGDAVGVVERDAALVERAVRFLQIDFNVERLG